MTDFLMITCFSVIIVIIISSFIIEAVICNFHIHIIITMATYRHKSLMLDLSIVHKFYILSHHIVILFFSCQNSICLSFLLCYIYAGAVLAKSKTNTNTNTSVKCRIVTILKKLLPTAQLQ